MKTLQTSCQVCRRSMELEYDPEMFTEEWMHMAATCDDCLSQHDERERTRIVKYHKAIERECRDDLRETNFRYPYRD